MELCRQAVDYRHRCELQVFLETRLIDSSTESGFLVVQCDLGFGDAPLAGLAYPCLSPYVEDGNLRDYDS